MFIVDTNVLLNAANGDAVDHSRSKEALESYVAENVNFALTWGIVYEFFRVGTHKKVFSKPLSFDQAYGFITQLITNLNCQLITESNIHNRVMHECRNEVHRLSGNIIHDFHTAVLMKEHGIKEIITFDTDYRAFPWIKSREP